MKSKLLLFALLSAFLSPALSQSPYAPRHNYGAKFEPADQIIHGAGQNEELALALYADTLPRDLFPALFMTYIPSRADLDRRQRTMRELRDLQDYYPDSLAIQVGMSMSSGGQGYTQAIIDGEHDESIDAIARGLDSLDRQIFVRIGYEANGFWNGYDAATYPQAFRHVAERLTAVSDRIAIVWCTHPITSFEDMMTYYPGDEVVDWWAIDLFQRNFIENAATANFLAEAHARRKPVMIGESTPTMTGVGAGDQSWNDWYEPFFAAVRENAGIKAICYINRDWAAVSSLADWENSLLHDDTVVLRRYIDEVSDPVYLHLPLEDEHLTDVLRATGSLELRANESAGDAPAGSFRVGSFGADTLTAVVDFDLSDLANRDLRRVKLRLAGFNDSPERLPLLVTALPQEVDVAELTYANRPAAVDTLGSAVVRDRENDRYRLTELDLTSYVRDALEREEARLLLSFVVPTEELGDGSEVEPGAFSFHAANRDAGYPPMLQVVYDRLPASEPEPDSTSSTRAQSPPTGIVVAPNPSSGAFVVHTELADYSIRIISATGQVVYETRGLSDSTDLSLRGAAPGMYRVLVSATIDGQPFTSTRTIFLQP